jgi:hypothetical protein
MDYRHLQPSESRITLTSVLLLAIFISAAAFIVSAIVWQPWNADEVSIIAPLTDISVIVEPAPDDLDVLVQPVTE